MPAHNESQQSRLTAISGKYGIGDSALDGLNLDNIHQVQEMNRKFGRATSDSDFQRVQGEIAAANKLRDLAHKTLNDKEFLKWEEKWKEYQEFSDPAGTYNIGNLAPSRFKDAAPANFIPAVNRVITRFKGKDVNDPDVVDAIQRGLIFEFENEDLEQAIEQGYLIEDGSGNAVLNPELLETVTSQLGVLSDDKDEDDPLGVGDLSNTLQNKISAESILDNLRQGDPGYEDMVKKVILEDKAEKAAAARKKNAPKSGKKLTVSEQKAISFDRNLQLIGIDTSLIQADIKSASGKPNEELKLLKNNFNPDSVHTFEQLNAILTIMSGSDISISQLTKDAFIQNANFLAVVEAFDELYKDEFDAANEDIPVGESAVYPDILHRVRDMIIRIRDNVFADAESELGFDATKFYNKK